MKELNGSKHGGDSGQYPHFIGIRISDRMYNDLVYIKKVRKSSDSYIVREALQQWLNKAMFTAMGEMDISSTKEV